VIRAALQRLFGIASAAGGASILSVVVPIMSPAPVRRSLAIVAFAMRIGLSRGSTALP
jgi:hypothetical protein